MADDSVEMLRRVARALEGLPAPVLYVGGATVGLYLEPFDPLVNHVERVLAPCVCHRRIAVVVAPDGLHVVEAKSGLADRRDRQRVAHELRALAGPVEERRVPSRAISGASSTVAHATLISGGMA